MVFFKCTHCGKTAIDHDSYFAEDGGALRCPLCGRVTVVLLLTLEDHQALSADMAGDLVNSPHSAES